jgi:hypothetical protein
MPEASAEQAHLGAWHVAAASVRGTSHDERGLPCQDAHAFIARSDGVLVAAVADGAGSASQSAVGATIAAEGAVEVLDGHLDLLARSPAGFAAEGEAPDAGVPEAWHAIMLGALRAGARRIEQLADSEGRKSRDYACTLTCLVATPNAVITGQVGDCAAVVQLSGHGLVTVGVPQRGEYANEAYFITMPEAPDLLDVSVVEGQARAVALLSDGLLRIATDTSDFSPHTPFFEPLLEFVARSSRDDANGKLAAFLRSERVCSRTDDDKTLLIAVRSNGPAATSTRDAARGPGTTAEPEPGPEPESGPEGESAAPDDGAGSSSAERE